MKMTIDELRSLIREEYLQGVPEFVLRQATERYVDEIRQHIKRFIVVSKSRDATQQRESMTVANKVLEELEEEVHELLEAKLYQFVRQV